MRVRVWVDSWQMQCCGEPFRVGSQVEWTLGDADRDWINAMLGPDAQQAADAMEEHRGGLPAETPPTRGTVTRIAAARCRYAPRHGCDSRARYPVPGSGVLSDAESADGWTPDHGDLQFAGYLAQFER
jgi:hypothetical protein